MATSNPMSDEQFLCSVCLDVFTEPVTTSCGHNFCRTCISGYWKTIDLCQCPICTHKFHTRPDLLVNTFIVEMAAQFRKLVQVKTTSSPDQCPAKPGDVSCDVYTEMKLKALKSCLSLRKAEGLIKELEQETTELKRRSTELEQLSHTEDDLNLLQSFPSPCSPPLTKDSDLCVGIVRRAVSQLEETVMSEMKRLFDDELKRIQQYAVDVTLDPDTASPWLILSKNGKEVRTGEKKQKLPDNPKRFDSAVNVLGKKGFSSGRFYYEVTVTGKTEWNLGVARESINRKGTVALSPDNGRWAVILRDGSKYTACAATRVHLCMREKPQKVGVFVDYEEGQVSFYDVEARSHIYSFTGYIFTEKLYPYFSPLLNDGGKNSTPLIISPVNHTD
ncbi:zinc-binding protein A33-like [Salvelinus fontinalis]|uniref:zinc-binding protein A33-like n=1 Tax=Salvelinus fontinalis TaxID=8038 RepID=UPI002486337D|nr:zinc-binding protein A33-like [Salvelinus fontinalis]